MKAQIKNRILNAIRVGLVACLTAGGYSELAAQEKPQSNAISAVGPRREAGTPALRLRPAPQAPWSISEREGSVAPQPEIFPAAGVERPFFSARGALIGAAIGCAVGAVAFYDGDAEDGSQRVGWSAGACVLLSIPGATFGSFLIP